ncbi:MAG: hypothetical protein EKK33_29870 [Bradyrhizobiaceae bacterium]|nr:MAG: hypothetical protein EKK33_29870 [Bradyrhizobiaceae bacterium]
MKLSRSLLWQLMAAMLPTMSAAAHPLDRGLAIVDPAAVEELDDKLIAKGGDLWKAIKAYNGSGATAEKYMHNVQAFTEYREEVTGP